MKQKENLSEQKPETRGRKSQSAYPWDTIKVGGTFFWAEDWSEEESKRVNSQIQYYQNKLGKKFSQRKIENRIKIWCDE